MRAATVQAFLDAADDLLSAQQRHMPDPLPPELQALAVAYLKKRAAVLSARQSNRGRGDRAAAKSR